MNVFVARQPIFDKNKRVFAYELLFRESLQNIFSHKDGDYATSKLLSNVFTAIGIDQISPYNPVFVNFTEKLLKDKVPLIFPKDKLVIEILENVDATKEIVDITSELVERGYKVALDDFFFKANVEELIKKVHIIKIDFRADESNIESIVAKLSKYKKILLAEKVETEAEFRKAVELGFKLFQGYFFEKPHIIVGKEILPLKTNLILLLSEIQKDSWELKRLEEYIIRDPSLTYKLLRFINSAFFGRLVKVEEVKHALTLLGEREIKAFLSMLLIGQIAQEKPSELISNSVIRAKFCEELAVRTGNVQRRGAAFTTGLFSLLDAMMDVPMELALEGLPLDEEIVSALLGGDNLLARFLSTAKAYMTGQWGILSTFCDELGLSETLLPEIYFDSLKWANALAEII